jgi:ADP-heptose:LPS heptosyltransferase
MKKVKNRIAALLYKTVLMAVKLLPSKKGQQHLLLIKTDEIGDYVLFHSYLKYFRQSNYKGYKITLVGNKAWQQIFEAYDRTTVDDTIWLNKKDFKKSLGYRYSFLKQIRAQATSDVVNCIFSRNIDADDAIAWAANGAYKVAMKGDQTNRGQDAKDQDKSIYTEIIDAGDEKVFDAVRNRNFIETVLGISNIPVETKINVRPPAEPLPFRYFILFLGAGNPERKWPLDSFLQVADYARDKYSLVPVICGGPDDAPEAERFVNQYEGEAHSYAGKTSLLQLIELLSGAQFLVCVDTGALHMAAAVKCPVVGLYSGKFYGRFAPYPKEITDQFYPVYPDFVDRLIAKKDPVLYNTFIMKNDTMKMIPPVKVVLYVDEIMKQKQEGA